MAWSLGDYPAARALHAESLGIGQALGDKSGIAEALGDLGLVARSQGDEVTARSVYIQSLSLRRVSGDEYGIAHCLAGLAGVACLQGRVERAGRLAGATDALLERLSSRLEPAHQAAYERDVAALRVRVGEAAFAAAWA